MYGYIYKITVNDSNSILYNCYYIGRHISKKFDDGYYGSGVIIKDYINKKGTDFLKKDILCICESENELNEKELKSIGDLYQTDSYFNGGKCLNMKAGGDCGLANDEAKRKMSMATSGSNNGFYGKHHSQQLKDYYSKLFNGEKNPMYGKHHSQEAKNKIRNSRLGTKHTQETIVKYRNIRQGLHWWHKGYEQKFCKECPGKDWKKGRSFVKKVIIEE